MQRWIGWHDSRRYGATTVEIKSGYGLSRRGRDQVLRVIAVLCRESKLRDQSRPGSVRTRYRTIFRARDGGAREYVRR